MQQRLCKNNKICRGRFNEKEKRFDQFTSYWVTAHVPTYSGSQYLPAGPKDSFGAVRFRAKVTRLLSDLLITTIFK